MGLLAWLGGCEAPVERPPAPEHDGIYAFAQGCYALDATEPGETDTRWLAADETGEGFAFTARSVEEGARLFLKPADLGTYLFRDAEGRWLVADDGPLLRRAELLSDVLLLDDTFVSGAEWELEVSAHDPERFQLHHRRSGGYLGREGVVPDEAAAAVVALYPTDGCTPAPELTVDAEGAVERTRWPDGDLYGVVETHAHLLTNFGFGGGGIFHGAPFHRLGVEHALPSCEPFHGGAGRRDLMGYAFNQGRDLDQDALIGAFVSGRTPERNHETAGWPEFTDWPDARDHATHQQQYYRWLERAYLGGLRLLVQHATTNEIICEMMVGLGSQDVRYSCNDMVAVDRQIEEVYNLERYIDAQEGGPGRGWFRIVTSPEEAREVIADGRMAVILGIETSNLFDCFVAPRDGFEACDEASVSEALDRYHERGIRVIFPVHKYDNAFSAGDGDRAIIELGAWINSGHWSNFTQDCDLSVPTVFDRGGVTFGGLNQPRDVYASAPPNDVLTPFRENPVAGVSPYLPQISSGALEGEWCQNAGMTPLGEHLMGELMRRGMLIEVDHFPRRAYARAFELLEAADYPALGTHGTNYDGRIYALGGMSKTGLGRCADPADPRAMTSRIDRRVEQIAAAGAYPAEGFGFDMNGFAGAPAPRFGDDSPCETPQRNPVEYPFTSFAGDVTFTEPRLGNRTVDFDTEGMIHLGLFPELVEDARRGGAPDEALEPFFRSAEGYLRMWERAEARAAAMP